jgi:uncharacterized protein YgiM (DUF1202 family)
MAIGDLSNLVCTVGPLDLVNTYGVTLMELTIYEDMETPTGPYGDAFVIDAINGLDVNVITGKEPVTVSITSNNFNTTAAFNMSLMQNIEVKPGSEQGGDGAGGGSLYHKEYKFRFCSPEFVTCQGNYVKDDFNEPCSSIVQKIVQQYFPGTLPFSCPDPTEFTRRMIAQYEHPLKFLNRVIDDSISMGHKSSLYVLYKNRTNFIYETYENAFTHSNGQTLTLRNELKISQETDANRELSIFWIEGEAFYRPSRPQNKNYIITYNMATGEMSNPLEGSDIGPEFIVLGQYIYTQAPNPTTGVPIFHIISPENNPEPFKLAVAKKYRLAFQSHLMQDSVTFCCVGNPNLNIGTVVTLVIPSDYKSSSAGEPLEQQLAQQFLITAITHKVRGVNMTPRYIMICRGIKAAYAAEGSSAG